MSFPRHPSFDRRFAGLPGSGRSQSIHRRPACPNRIWSGVRERGRVRLLALLSTISAAAVLASCAGSGPPQLAACFRGRATPAAEGRAPPLRPFVGIVQAASAASAVLARLDPLSLKPVSGQVNVPEYHDAWSLSPDRTEVALGVSAGESVLAPARTPNRRIGVYIVDLKTMRVVREVQTGVAAEAIGWLGPRRLVAALQRGGTVLVDPSTGRVVRRWPSFSFPDASALTPLGLVMLLPSLRASAPNVPLTRTSGPPRLAVVDGDGRLRSVSLKRIPLDVRTSDGISYEERAGLAVEAAHARAYVVAPNARIAVVDLRTMRVSYRLDVVAAEPSRSGTAGQRGALRLGNGRIAIYGRDIAAVGGGKLMARPAGVSLVDTHDWSACKLDRRASRATLAAGRLLAYGPGSSVSAHEPGEGLRAYALDGRKTFHLFGQQQVSDVEVAGGRAYVRTATAVHVVDVMSGELEATIRPPVDLAEVIGPPP
jgi:hypothetical protein